MAQTGTLSGLTGKKLKVAEMLASPDFDGTTSDLLKECGVPRRTFYNWLADKTFLDGVNTLVERHADGELPKVWKALIRQCEKGDTQAIKLFFELKGRYKNNVAVEIVESNWFKDG